MLYTKFKYFAFAVLLVVSLLGGSQSAAAEFRVNISRVDVNLNLSPSTLLPVTPYVTYQNGTNPNGSTADATQLNPKLYTDLGAFLFEIVPNYDISIAACTYSTGGTPCTITSASTFIPIDLNHSGSDYYCIGGNWCTSGLNNLFGMQVTTSGNSTNVYAKYTRQLSNVSCSATPSPVTARNVVTWTATPPVGGTGTYTYAWSGAVTGSTASVTNTYATPGTQTANLTVTSGTQTKSVQCSVTVTLPTVSVTATDATASEPGSDTGTFTISRTGATNLPLTVSVGMTGTAGNGLDYSTISSTVTIPAGALSTTVTLTPIDDLLVEGTETAILTINSSSAYTTGSPSNATVNINDNDVLPTISVTATDATASEPGSDTGTFTISRTGPTVSALTVSLAMSGTATNGTDYTAISTTATIPAGVASVSIVLTPTDDSLIEGSETAIMTLGSNALYIVGSPSSATVTIADNDSAPSAPTGVTATNSCYASGGSPFVIVNWIAVSGATSYKVFRTTAGVTTQIATPSSNAYTDNTAVVGTSYTYTIKAVANGIDSTASTASNSVTVAGACPLAPSAPTSLTATSSCYPAGGTASVVLSWTASSGSGITYKVFKNGSATALATGISGTTYTDTAVIVGQTPPTYTVKANNTGGDSPASNTATSNAIQSQCTAPTLTASLSANPASGVIPPTPFNTTLTATAGGSATGATTYQFRCDITGSYSAQSSTATYPCSYSTSGDHYPSVVIIRQGLTANTQITVTVNSLPANPTGVTATNSCSTSGNNPFAQISWNAVSGYTPANYTIYKTISGVTTAYTVAQLGPYSNTSVTDNAVTAGQVITYAIKATNGVGSSAIVNATPAPVTIAGPCPNTLVPSLVASPVSGPVGLNPRLTAWDSGNTIVGTTYTYQFSCNGSAGLTTAVPQASNVYTACTYPSIGTYTPYVRINKTYNGNTLTNPASATVTIVPAPVVTLVANPNPVASGGTIILGWTANNGATECHSTGANSFNTSNNPNYSVSVSNVTSARTYSISCSGPGGTGTASANVTVTVAPPAPTASLTVTPTSVLSGGTTLVKWSSTNADSCDVYYGLYHYIVTNGPTSNTVGVTSPALTADTTFYLVCYGPATSAGDSATVTVIVPPPVAPAPTVALVATPGTINSGDSALLTWTSTNADSCTSSDFATANATNNSVGVSTGALTANHSYAISCTGAGGTIIDSVTVIVTGDNTGCTSDCNSGCSDVCPGGGGGGGGGGCTTDCDPGGGCASPRLLLNTGECVDIPPGGADTTCAFPAPYQDVPVIPGNTYYHRSIVPSGSSCVGPGQSIVQCPDPLTVEADPYYRSTTCRVSPVLIPI